MTAQANLLASVHNLAKVKTYNQPNIIECHGFKQIWPLPPQFLDFFIITEYQTYTYTYRLVTTIYDKFGEEVRCFAGWLNINSHVTTTATPSIYHGHASVPRGE